MLDLLSPNQLKKECNSEQSLEGCVIVAHSDKILENIKKIFNAWFEVWFSAHVPKFVDQPKWFKSDENLKLCDLVLFLKQDSAISSIKVVGKDLINRGLTSSTQDLVDRPLKLFNKSLR